MPEKNLPEENRTHRRIDEAATDIRYLLERGYRKDSAIRFVCDHHRIPQTERYILARTVCSSATASERKKKKLRCEQLKGRTVLVDGYNVLITLESLLREERTFVADDSFLRDVRGVFRNHSNDIFTSRAVEKMLSFLAVAEVEQADILLDTQMKHSGELASFIRSRMKELSIKGNAGTSKHVDHDLKTCDGKKVVATADGIIIDAVRNVIDIPGCIAMKMDGR
ncbi:DUF434 domain-containing protein [Methanolobus profundi]|uniref:DUF434 domain-containing protein n=1 Tax=Methanolobus profundi TaxID=487685 RepID=A0A1I4NKI1_9EURY|nr:DUF434 domain-containing protein [Methanolobus profundi]SFM15986.1 hypothetical protein SAMN04488696_0110 [Methanolobus profundi]